MNHPFRELLLQRLPYILILALFFCLVPWKSMELFSSQFWIVLAVTGLFLFQIIKNNTIIWGLIVFLFSFYACWMVLAFLSDLNKAGEQPKEFIVFGSLFLVALFLMDIWLIRSKPREGILPHSKGDLFL